MHGWIRLDGTKYYADEKGALISGIHQIGGLYHFFNRNGARIFSVRPIVLFLLVLGMIAAASSAVSKIRKRRSLKK